MQYLNCAGVPLATSFTIGEIYSSLNEERMLGTFIEKSFQSYVDGSSITSLLSFTIPAIALTTIDQFGNLFDNKLPQYGLTLLENFTRNITMFELLTQDSSLTASIIENVQECFGNVQECLKDPLDLIEPVMIQACSFKYILDSKD